MKKKLYITIIFFVIFVIFYLFFRNIIDVEYQDQLQLTILRSINLIIFIMAIVISYKYFKNNYIIFLFLISLFIFQYGRVNFIWLFGKYKEEMNWFVYYPLDFKMKLLICDILFCNIVGTICGIFYCIFIQKKRIKEKIKINIYSKKIKILILILIFSLPFYIYGECVVLKELSNNAYADLYKKGLTIFNSKGVIIKIFSNVFICCLYFVLALKIKNKKWNRLICLFYLTMTLLITLRGARTPFVAGIFFLIWYCHYLYEIKIKLVKVSFIFILLIIFSQIFGGIRENVEESSSIKVIEKIEKFMYQQGVIGTFLSTPITYPELYKKDKVPYLFSSVTGIEVQSQDKSISLIKNSKNIQLSQKISYLLNQKMYLNGNGIGGNYILEMYDFAGELGVFILSLLFIVIIDYYSNYIFDERNFLFFRMLLILKMPMIFLVPRGNYIFFKISLKELFIYGACYLTIKCLIGTNKLNEKIESIT